jgi:hypothetical protein
MAEMINPGAMKSAKRTPMMWMPLRPCATVKIVSSSSALTAGAHSVCMWTFKNRRTSFI